MSCFSSSCDSLISGKDSIDASMCSSISTKIGKKSGMCMQSAPCRVMMCCLFTYCCSYVVHLLIGFGLTGEVIWSCGIETAPGVSIAFDPSSIACPYLPSLMTLSMATQSL